MSADPEIIISHVIESHDGYSEGASHREVMIAQGIVPEHASEDVAKSVGLAHEASALHERIIGLYQRAQQEVGGKLTELETQETKQVAYMRERIGLFTDLTKAFERLAISVDITFYDVKIAEGHFQSQGQKVLRIEQEAARCKEAIAEQDQSLVAEVGNEQQLVRSMNPLQIRAARRYNEQEEKRAAEQSQLIGNVVQPDLIDLTRPIPNNRLQLLTQTYLGPEEKEEYYALDALRQPIHGKVADLKMEQQRLIHHSEQLAGNRAAAGAHLNDLRAHLQTLLGMQTSQAARYQLLGSALKALTSELTTVIASYEADAEYEVPQIDEVLATKARQIFSDTSVDRTPIGHKYQKEALTRSETIMQHRKPNVKAEHLDNYMQAFSFIDDTVNKSTQLIEEVQATYAEFRGMIISRLDILLGGLNMRSQDTESARSHTIDIAIEQDRLDQTHSQLTQELVSLKSAIDHRNQLIHDRGGEADRLLQQSGDLGAQKNNIESMLQAIDAQARAVHDAREAERLRIARGEQTLSAEEAQQWAEHDLMSAEGISGYQPHVAWSDNVKHDFPGVVRELLPESQFGSSFDDFRFGTIEVQQLGQQITELQTRRETVVRQILSLERDRDGINLQAQEKQRQLVAVLKDIDAQRVKFERIVSSLILAQRDYEESMDEYANFKQDQGVTTATTPAKESVESTKSNVIPIFRDAGADAVQFRRQQRPLEQAESGPRARSLEDALSTARVRGLGRFVFRGKK